MSLKGNCKLWIYSENNEGVFGDGKYRLLAAIHKYHSLSQASQKLGISYRKAWADLKKAESCLNRQLVIRTRGGKNGGNTELTEDGLIILEAYRKMREAVDKAISSSLSNSFSFLLKNSTAEQNPDSEGNKPK